MKLVFFDRYDSKYSIIEPFIIVRPLFILSELLYVDSIRYYKTFYALNIVDNCNDEEVYKFMKISNDQFGNEFHQNVRNMLDFYKKRIKNQRWTKEGDAIKRNMIATMLEVRSYYRDWHKNILELTFTEDIREAYLAKKYRFYVDAKVVVPVSKSVNDNAIFEFVDNILDKDYCFVFSEFIDSGFKHGAITDSDTELKDEMFFSCDIARFPLLHDINFEQLGKIITDVSDEIEGLGGKFAEFKKVIDYMTYGDANMVRTVNNFVLANYPRVQAKLDSNIFIQKQYNSYSPSDVMTVKLGISSYNNMLEMYVGCNILSKDEKLEIKEKLAKNMDLDKCVIIVYVKLPEVVNEVYKEFTETYTIEIENNE